MNEYEQINSFFDDPIINTFKDEYYAEFVHEADDDIKPLKIKQILLLDNHLETIENKIEEYQNENNSEQINEIKENLEELRSYLSSKPKKWVLDRLTIIWAKLSKHAPAFINDFFKETKKEGFKQGARALIDAFKDSAQDLLS